MPVQDLLMFLGAALLLAITPGPDNVFVMAQGALYGWRAGVLVTLGLCTGLVVHTAAVALGLAALIQRSDVAFSGLKYAGGAYLLYLSWRAFREGEIKDVGTGVHTRSPWGLYLRGIVMNVMNPKVSLFFLAFLPQFADPSRGPLWPQIAILGALFMLATLLVFSGIAVGAGSFGGWLNKSPGAQIWMQRSAGLLFAGLALRLIWAKK
jgi:threonine/homoserine/homoserine lactone efflux protein